MIELIGIISILVGIFWMLKLTINNKPIVFLKLAGKETSFYINQEGKYAISTVKGKFITILNGFKIIINQNFKSNSDLIINELKIRNKTINKWHIGVEFLQFEIIDTGSYNILIENANKLIVKEPRFASKSRILDKIKTDDIELAIEKYYPFYHRILAVLLIIIGIIISIIWLNI